MNFIPEIDQHATNEELAFFTNNLRRTTVATAGTDLFETVSKEMGTTTLERETRRMGLYSSMGYYDGFLNEIFEIQLVEIDPLSKDSYHTDLVSYPYFADDPKLPVDTDDDDYEHFLKQEYLFTFRREAGYEYPYDYSGQEETTSTVHAEKYLDVSICDEDEIEVLFLENVKASTIKMEKFSEDLCAPTRRDLLFLNHEMIAAGVLALEVTAYDTAPKYIPVNVFFE